MYLPPVEAFHSQEGHAGTLLHEIGHATGAAKRLNREGIVAVDTGDREKYAREELRAEIFSAFMAAETGIPWDRSQHESYVQSWSEALKKDKNEIFRAAAEAGKAVDYVLDKERGIEVERRAPEHLTPVEVKPQEHDIGDNAAPRVVSAAFVHKPGDGERLVEQLAGEKKTEQARIIESRNLSRAEYDAFVGDLFADHDWLKGKGGIEPLPQGGQQRHVIELMAKDRQTLLVDPSGHGYARIVGIPEADIARVVESKSLAVPADPGKRPELAPEDALQEKRWHEKRAGDLAPGDRIMERIPGHAAFVDSVDDVRSIRDGKVHVDLNNDTATRVYAEDEKVTVIGESQEPPEKSEPERQAPARRAVLTRHRGMDRGMDL